MIKAAEPPLSGIQIPFFAMLGSLPLEAWRCEAPSEFFLQNSPMQR
jgi:hypothetical protein